MAERAGIMKALLTEQMTRRGAPRDGRRGEDKLLPTVEGVRRSASSKLRQFAHQAAFLALADTDSCSRYSTDCTVLTASPLGSAVSRPLSGFCSRCPCMPMVHHPPLMGGLYANS